MKILVINGPNLNMLGIREPELYGGRGYGELCEFITSECSAASAQCEIFQSNCEGAIVDKIQSAVEGYDALIINAAAYSHTSVAVLDALKCLSIPRVEVHLTDISAREEFRRFSYTSLACERTFSGKGFQSYAEAIKYVTAGGN